MVVEVPVLTGKGTRSLVMRHAMGLSVDEPDPEFPQRGPCEVPLVFSLVHCPEVPLTLPDETLYQFLEGKACPGYPSRGDTTARDTPERGLLGEGAVTSPSNGNK